MGLLYNSLFYFTSITTALSGGLGFLLKLPAFYKPEAYLIGGLPATGKTQFELVATFVFGLVYTTPLPGLVYAHVQGSTVAKRVAALAPLAYHAASVYGVLAVFPSGLNPAVAPLASAAGMHVVYALLFAAQAWAAEDEPAGKGARAD